MQFNEKFIYIVSKNRHICYIFAIFRTLFICLFYSYFLFLFKKSHQPDENAIYIFIWLMAFIYEQAVNEDCLIHPTYRRYPLIIQIICNIFAFDILSIDPYRIK